MAQPQGNSTADGGRLNASLGTALATTDFALGAGWGSTAAVTSVTGTDQAYKLVITSGGTGQAQATATVTHTFKDLAFTATPVPMVTLGNSTSAAADPQPTGVAATTTTLAFTSGVLPVAAKVYTFYVHNVSLD